MTWGQLASAISRPAGPSPARRGTAARWARPNHLEQIATADWFGLRGDALPPTRAEALSVPAMARARHLITSVARLPVRLDPHHFDPAALVLNPDPTRTRAAMWTDTLDDLLFHGTALWKITERYAADDRAREARYISLDRVSREPDGTWLIDELPVMDRDLIWFEGPHAGILQFGGRALRSAVRLERAYNAVAANPAVAIELHQVSGDVLDDAEITALVDQARQAVRDRGVLYTNEALELRTHAASAENLLIAGRTAAAVEIARMVGLPAGLLDANPPGSSGTYQNSQVRLREARDLGLEAYAAAITERLSLQDTLPRGVRCAVDWNTWLRDDFTARMAGYKAAQEAGIFTAEECRELELGRPMETPR